MACQHFPDDQTLQLQAGAGEDDVIHLPSGLDRVDCERQEEEEEEDSGAKKWDMHTLMYILYKFLNHCNYSSTTL